MKASWIDTPLGPMIAVSDDEALYLLEFVGTRGLDREIERLRQKTKSAMVPGLTQPISSIENELKLYFSNQLSNFKTPVHLLGSAFQQRVWKELKKIPMGETRSYFDISVAIGNPQANRAVANANGANQLALIIPCHRVINKDGKLGGYSGGIKRKEWLLNHEMKGMNISFALNNLVLDKAAR